MDTPRIGSVLYATGDMDATVAFYRDAVGLPVKFQDAARYAALDGGGVTFALVGAEEDVTAGVPAIALKVGDVDAAVARVAAAGAEVLRGPETGPHETRAVVRDPAGDTVVLYAPLPRP